MKFFKSLMLACSLFAFSACTTNQGIALTVENASTYLKALNEGEGNANFTKEEITFYIYPNSTAGKLFSPDIKGKCNLSYKYSTGFFNWSQEFEAKDVSFVYYEGETSESGFKNVDSLKATFPNPITIDIGMINVYNVVVTEISGHMLP